MKENTPADKFGKDHWSLLAYVEHCCVNGRDGFGKLDRRRLRCNPNNHMLAGVYSNDTQWKLNHGTRSAGFFDFEERNDPEKAIAAGVQLLDHDDWDCLDDLEAAGYIEVLSLVNGFVKMTVTGCDVAAKLRAHKAHGGQFAGFRLDALACPAYRKRIES